MSETIPPTPYNIGALAHNALQATLAGLGEWMRLSDRVAVADAVVAAVEPMIREAERERIRVLAKGVAAAYAPITGGLAPFSELLETP